MSAASMQSPAIDDLAGESFDVVIVGAGIMGLSIAHHLTKAGTSRVLIVDRGYLCSGASGRNGGGVRAQWSSETNVRLMQESIRMCGEFAAEMKINVWFRQGGYLFLVRSEARSAELERSVAMQNDCGLDSRILTPREAGRLVPELSTDGVIAASYNPKDGVVFPWPFVWGFAQSATKRGATLRTFTEVTALDVAAGRIQGLTLRQLDSQARALGNPVSVRTEVVVNACGAWSPTIAAMAGVSLPNTPHRHEICSTEPLKPWLGPLVADLSNGLYFSQSTRGEIVGGIGQVRVPHGINQESSLGFLGRYADALTRTCPVLGAVKVLRQWAGCYDLTPDANPIVGFTDEVGGLYQASGFMGHGFMMAPVMGKRIANHLHSGTACDVINRWNLRRYREGKMLSEAMIIG
jgi:sarcosine oxidase, subunit beta